MGCQKSLGCCTGVIPCPIMDEKQGLRGLLHEHLQEPVGTFRMKPPLDTLMKQVARERLSRAKHFVAFGVATCFDLWFLPSPLSSDAERATLGTTVIILR